MSHANDVIVNIKPPFPDAPHPSDNGYTAVPESDGMPAHWVRHGASQQIRYIVTQGL